jgi:thymidine kinase
MCKDNPVRMCGNCATPHCKTLERIQQVMPPKTTFIKPDAKLINKIIVKTGAMQSGKTEDEIVQYFRLTKINELSCVIFKPAVDTRSDENCVESFTKLTAPCVSCKTLSFCDDIINYLKENCHVIIIEEAQFFGEELIDFVDMMVNTLLNFRLLCNSN